MVEIGWNTFSQPQPDKEYVMLVSRLPLKHYWNIAGFFRHTGRIRSQLSESTGLIGYSLRLSLLRKTGWTVSVWENEQLLSDFVRKNPHSATMAGLRNSMKQTKFVTKKILGSAVPPSWPEALEYLG
jgi:hypothetical protein